MQSQSIVPTLILVAANLIVGVAVGAIGWSLRRLVRQNDEMHARDAARVDKLLEAIAAERDSRHEGDHAVDTRVWQLHSELPERYQTRHEGMRLYGALSRKTDAHHRELMDRLDGLPCRQAQGPTEGQT